MNTQKVCRKCGYKYGWLEPPDLVKYNKQPCEICGKETWCCEAGEYGIKKPIKQTRKL